MKLPRRRRLRPDEITLWRAVAATVDLRRPDSILPPEASRPAADFVQDVAGTIASPAPQTPPQLVAAPRRAPPLAVIDRRTRQKILRGHVGIERRIDLHGMTQADAHAALRGFLLRAQAEDLRLVLVVTGKGERTRSPHGFGEVGVLKRVVPHWLRDLDLRKVVLGFEPAGPAHGGAGALYIRLRRRKLPA